VNQTLASTARRLACYLDAIGIRHPSKMFADAQALEFGGGVNSNKQTGKGIE
jgi:hypothetical protein